MEGRQLYGITTDERLGLKHFTETIHPDDREMVAEAMQAALTTGRYSVECRVVLPDGSTRWIAASGVMVSDAEGKPFLLRGVSIDVSERRMAETESATLRLELAHLSRVDTFGDGIAARPVGWKQPMLTGRGTDHVTGCPVTMLVILQRPEQTVRLR